MILSTAATIRARVGRIESMPSIPTIFLPLLELMKVPPEKTQLDEVVKLISYDNTIAAQCLRVASSPLFGLSKTPETIKSAVVNLGLRRVETILLTCCMGQAFPTKDWALDPTVFWRHSLGVAMVCRRFSEKIGGSDHEKAYMAGLMHDIGLIVNCMVFPREFAQALTAAKAQAIPLFNAEQAVMGFTHCDSGRSLAEKWHLSSDVIQVISHHHEVGYAESAQSLVALVHISDLLCRIRNLDYGYDEQTKLDLVDDPAWTILRKDHRNLDGVDLAEFTFELDEAAGEIYELVSTIFGPQAAKR